MAEIDRILAQQERELLRLEEAEVRAFLKVYNDARKDLRDRMTSATERLGVESWTVQHTRIARAEVESGVKALEDRLNTLLGKQVQKRMDFSLENLKKTIGHFEPDFLGTSAGINLKALKRMTRDGDLLLHRYSTSRYSADLMGKIQAELARGHAARLPRSEVVKRIAGLDGSVFSGMEHRAALIDRMENARAYDTAFRTGLEEAAVLLDEEDDPDPLLKKAIEFIDKRSHPFSAVVDGRVARLKGEWMVPVSLVREAGRRMKKSISGVVWPLEGGFYRGATYPAHFNDRGRGIPWRASWGPFVGEIPPEAAKPSKTKPAPKPKEVKATKEKKKAPKKTVPKKKTTPKRRAPKKTAVPAPSPFAPKAELTRDYWTTRTEGRAGAGTLFDSSEKSKVPAKILKRGKGVKTQHYAQIKEAAELIPEKVQKSLKANGYRLHVAPSLKKIPEFDFDHGMNGSSGLSNFKIAGVKAEPFMRYPPRKLTRTALHETGHALDGAWAMTEAGRNVRLPKVFSTSKAWQGFADKAIIDGTAQDFAKQAARNRMIPDGSYYISNHQEFFAEVCRMAWDNQGGRDFLESTWPGMMDSLDEMFSGRLSL